MSDTNSNTHRKRVEAGRKGGLAKVPKGLAKIKETDPKRFEQIIKKAVEARVKANKTRKN